MTVDLVSPLEGVLLLGSLGPPVQRLQLRLNELTRAGLTPDSAFGLRTLGAVRAWQTRSRLVPDGLVGPLTAAALGFTRYVHRAPYRPPSPRLRDRRAVPPSLGGALRDMALALIQSVGLIVGGVLRQFERVKGLLGSLWDVMQNTLQTAQARARQALMQLARWADAPAQAVEAALRCLLARLQRDLLAVIAQVAGTVTALAGPLAQMSAQLSSLFGRLSRVVSAVLGGVGGSVGQVIEAVQRWLRAWGPLLPMGSVAQRAAA